MSDYREVQHGYEILQRFFGDEKRRSAFISALDSFAPGVAKQAIDLFDRWWLDIYGNSYIASMSEHDDAEDRHGSLSMWRAFGGTSARVAIVSRIPFRSPAAHKLNCIFSPVAYLTEKELHSEMDAVTINIQQNAEMLRGLAPNLILNNIFIMLIVGVTCLKHEGFREEREWRMIYGPGRSPSRASGV